MELTLKTKKVKFGDIKPYENNPRINTQIAKTNSIYSIYCSCIAAL